MAPSKGMGVRFSEPKDNHESAQCWEWNRQRERTYTRYGMLPNGEGFGVARTPTQENYYARDVVIDRSSSRAISHASHTGTRVRSKPVPVRAST